MQKSDAKNDMKVVFGRPGDNAEKSIGVIVKCNPTRARVKLLEERGTRSQYAVGAMFNVPYSLMEVAPTNGDKSKVEIKGNRPTEIIPGQTTFRAVHADSNALWKVLSKNGRDTWLCQIVNEPVTVGDKTYPGDYAGTRKAFLSREILGSIDMGKLFEGYQHQHEKFYASLYPGQTIHYHNGFDNWVRCTVVEEDGKYVLKATALVGDWKSHDLPRRMRDGSVYNGYNADKVLNGDTFTPNASNLFENGCKPRNGIDPSTLTPVSLEVKGMSEAETATARLWHKVGEIHKITNAHEGNPQDVLDAVAKLL